MVRIVSVWEPFWKQITLYQSKSPLFEAANVVQIFTRTSCELAEKVAGLTPNPLPDKSWTVLSIECNGFTKQKKKPFLNKSLLLENATKLERSIRSGAHMLLILPICVQGLRHTSVCSPVSVTEGSLHAVDPATTGHATSGQYPRTKGHVLRKTTEGRRNKKTSINIMSMWMNQPTDGDDGGETKAGS